ncbi:MAG: helix-turn-helix domain-containing protein [Actinobacteria bacterium]|nr:helix-turn-helix domain-containing protein [Actinomycetota bacterium]
MGYRGKLQERQRARELRAQAWTLQEIADELDVSRSSVSVWVRDVQFTPKPRKRTARFTSGPDKLRRRKLDQIQRLLDEGDERIGGMSERDLLIAGVALYAGEGGKTDGRVDFANSDPRFIAFFCEWLRRFFTVDESRLRVYLYLHAGLDLAAANAYWSEVTRIPLDQFGKPYRAEPDGGIRTTKHQYGCPRISYCCSETHRAIMGLVHGLLNSVPLPVDLPQEFGPFYGV